MGYFQTVQDMSRSTGVNRSFINSWSALKALPGMTKVSDGGDNSFVSMCNSTTHEPTILKEPEYEPDENVDNSEYDANNRKRFRLNEEMIDVTTAFQMSHYHVNAAAMIALGNWFDYLRANGVWDNTRIIIVSDHGWVLGSHVGWQFGPEYIDDIMAYNPLLLVKDFGDTELKTDGRFMTNADTPVLAFDKLIPQPKNPFTGKPINSDAKKAPEHHVQYPEEHRIDFNNGNTLLPGRWCSLKGDNIFDAGSWSVLGEY